MTRWVAAIWQMPELRSRVLFTLFMLAVFRLGVHIPAPLTGQARAAGRAPDGAKDGRAASHHKGSRLHGEA